MQGAEGQYSVGTLRPPNIQAGTRVTYNRLRATARKNPLAARRSDRRDSQLPLDGASEKQEELQEESLGSARVVAPADDGEAKL